MWRYGRTILFCVLLVLAAAAGGCQRGPTWNLAPVEGTVTKGGRPLANVKVVFLADAEAGVEGLRSLGMTDEAGHYRLRTDNGDNGAAVGKYRVVVRDVSPKHLMHAMGEFQRKAAAKQLPPEAAKRLEEQRKTAANAVRIPPSYGHFNKTPLRVEVHPGPQTLDFDLP